MYGKNIDRKNQIYQPLPITIHGGTLKYYLELIAKTFVLTLFVTVIHGCDNAQDAIDRAECRINSVRHKR